MGGGRFMTWGTQLGGCRCRVPILGAFEQKRLSWSRHHAVPLRVGRSRRAQTSAGASSGWREAHGCGLTGGGRRPSAEARPEETANSACPSEPSRRRGSDEKAQARQPRCARDARGSGAVGRCSRCRVISVENGR